MSYLSQSGPLVWLVIAFGLVAVVTAIRYALRQSARDASLALGFITTSAVVALIATVAGFQKSVGGLREVAADDRWIYLWGLKESLNNVVVTLVFAFLVVLLLTTGSYRRANA